MQAFEQMLILIRRNVKELFREEVLALPSTCWLPCLHISGNHFSHFEDLLSKILYADILKRGREVTSVARDHKHDCLREA